MTTDKDSSDKNTTDTDDPKQAQDGQTAEEAARARIEEIELRLGGLFGAVSEGFREMTERIGPLVDAGQAHVERSVRVGGVAEFIDAMNAPNRPAPKHSIQQGDDSWQLQATLPDTRLPDIRLDLRPGRLVLTTPHHHLTCSLPEGLDPDAVEMSFRGGELTLTAELSTGGDG